MRHNSEMSQKKREIVSGAGIPQQGDKAKPLSCFLSPKNKSELLSEKLELSPSRCHRPAQNIQGSNLHEKLGVSELARPLRAQRSSLPRQQSINIRKEANRQQTERAAEREAPGRLATGASFHASAHQRRWGIRRATRSAQPTRRAESSA